jgi:hypothetical protein
MATVVAPLLALAILSGCALTKDRFRGFPLQGQTEEQRLQDQQECNDVALANKGNAAQAAGAMAATAAVVSAASGAAIGAGGLGGAFTNAGIRAGAGTAAGAGAALLIVAITEVERRGTAIYVACMRARGYALGE